MVTTWLPPVGVPLPRFLDDLHVRHLAAQQGPEGLVIVRALAAWERGERRGYQAHVATVMWRGHLRALCEYQVEVAHAWNRRGFESGTLAEYLRRGREAPDTGWPAWWGETPLHEQHSRSLVYRKPEHYGRLWPHVAPIDADEPFLWPGDPQHLRARELLAAQVQTWRGWRAEERRSA